MAEFRYVICDVFTDRPLEGNPLAVFTDARAIPEALLQPLAREMHLSETVFCYPARAGGHVRIRIFTPGHELPFAGHPVLGAAFVLAAPLQLPEIVLETGVGPVPVRIERDGPRIVFGRMVQPRAARRGSGGPGAPPPRARGCARGAAGGALRQRPAPRLRGPRRARPRWPRSSRTSRRSRACYPRGTTNCFAGEGRRWKTRAFAPGAGVAEDPATGSAAGPLACHLARHGRIPFGEEIEIRQGAEIHRPSVLFAKVDGTADAITRVEVGGSAVTVARGEFRLPG